MIMVVKNGHIQMPKFDIGGVVRTFNPCNDFGGLH
jgi:hypothetical protein